jgi:hypothetical protein
VAHTLPFLFLPKRKNRCPILDAFFKGRTCGQGWDNEVFRRLLVEAELEVMMMVVVMAVMYNHHDLRLRRIRCREAEDENQSKQNLFHGSV